MVIDADTIGHIISGACLIVIVVFFGHAWVTNELDLRRQRRHEKRDQEWADRHDRPRSW